MIKKICIFIIFANFSIQFLSAAPQLNEDQPTNSEYQNLKHLLSLYRKKKEHGGWPQLPKGTKLQIGDQGPLVETLSKQLIAQDALPSQAQGTNIFDDKLKEGVKVYQELHGLEPDGAVGPATLKALNTPVEERIHSIMINLERLRGYYSRLPDRYIQVNIPGFYLKAVQQGTPAFSMPIIIGKEYNKTPIFTAPMTEIIFNPSWHVPASIVKELLPKIQSNPSAYARKGYHVSHSDGGTRITQSPGNTNALGKIRFTLDNPFSIYLHGTPQKNLFLKAKRSLSHGCIRVQDPYKLAAFVFNDPQNWPLSRIKKEATGTKTKHVKLKKPLPTFIVYLTVFEDSNHKMHFVPDLYGRDKAISQKGKELKKK